MSVRSSITQYDSTFHSSGARYGMEQRSAARSWSFWASDVPVILTLARATDPV